MIYCFDTSALNQLLDEPEREPIIIAILAVGSVRISASNVIEIAKTTKEERRDGLFSLIRQLTDRKLPLSLPNKILLSYADAFSNRSSQAIVTIDENMGALWIAINQPELIDEEAREEAVSWAQEQESNFFKLIAQDRDKFQDFFRRFPKTKPKSMASTLRAFLGKKEQCHSLLSNIYERQTAKKLSSADYDLLVKEPVWALYFLGYVYGLYMRSIQLRKNAGGVDIAQAVYLALCDRFITHDRLQYRALRLLSLFNKKSKTKVLTYKNFKDQLLPLG
jgi:hypothetical protein